MATNSTLLCVHRDPAKLSALQENGYELVTATTGRDALRLFMSKTVDAIVLEYHLGLLDGAVIASEIKRLRPNVPIVMLAEHADLSDAALKSVDALVEKSDGPDFLLATLRFVLNMKPRPSAYRSKRRRTRHSREMSLDMPFSPTIWESILNGTVRF
jgi:DNA-binding response OmpR family regulator